MSRKSWWFAPWAWMLSSDQCISCTCVMMEYCLSELALLYPSDFQVQLLHCSPSSLISESTLFGVVACDYSAADSNTDDARTEPSWLHGFMSSDRATKSPSFTPYTSVCFKSFSIMFPFFLLARMFLSQLLQINHAFVAFIQVLRECFIYGLCYVNIHLIWW